ncbi:MAG: sulfatase-like hydrolase/transferase [Chloroflexota bacterium]
MKPTNLLFLFSDQHTRRMTGCYGHPVVQTPHIDSLAERGTKFNNAYTNCAICVPARASLATGRYVHQIGNWDNAFPYDGSVPSWHHRLREQGHCVDSIGKLHFSGPQNDHGFSEEVDPLHVVDGIGDLLGCIRDNPPFRNKLDGIYNAGPGDSTYLQYDARNNTNTCQWLRDHANDDKPWAAFASFVCPHPPYIAPQALYDHYAAQDLDFPAQWRESDWPDHPEIDYFRQFFGLTQQFDEATIRKLIAAYYGVCTYLDQQLGDVLKTLEETGLSENTRIIYSSDHGESLSARGLTGKFTMYEEAVAVPFVMAGPDVPGGKTVNTPISLVDCFPTIVEAVGAEMTDEDQDLPGRSLWEIAQNPDENRLVFSEYHAVGARTAHFMLRDQQYKYIHYAHSEPQLFDLMADPDELDNLVSSNNHQNTLQQFETELRKMLDPEAIDAQAKADQAAKVEAFGGEEAVRQRGAFTNSPVPGEAPAFRTFDN